MQIPSMPAILLVLSSATCFAAPDLAEVCATHPWQTRIPAHVPAWDSIPAKPNPKKPARWIDDTVSNYLFLECSKGWLRLMAPDGSAFWTKVETRAPEPVAESGPGLSTRPNHKLIPTAGEVPLFSSATHAASDKPAYVVGASETVAKVNVVGDSILVRTKTGEEYWAESKAFKRFEPDHSPIDLGSGHVEGYLDNPAAVYILKEESNPLEGIMPAPSVAPGSDIPSSELPPPARSPARRAGMKGGATGGPAFSPAPSKPTASGLQAGVSDDNRQFPSFLEFLQDRLGEGIGYDSRVRERIALHVADQTGRPVLGAQVSVRSGDKLLERGRTLADGSYLLFPLVLDSASKTDVYAVDIAHEAGEATITVDRAGPRSREIALGKQRDRRNLVVDLLFVLDVTGSMQPQIDQLKNAISILQMNLSALPSRPALRFGLVQFQDRNDVFRARMIPFTSDASIFSLALRSVNSGDGGDTPEDLQSALDSSLHRMNWSPQGIHLGFVVTDAVAHLDYGQTFTYVDAAHEARRRGIKLHAIGCGSLGIDGETILRQIAQATSGKYVFLARPGEKGESDGGEPGAVSHHTGSNWNSERLETAMLRLTRDEIAQQADVPPVDSLGWFEASLRPGLSPDSIFLDLFKQAWRELREFSPVPVTATSTVAVLAPVPSTAILGPQAARLGQELTIAVSRSGGCRLVDRGNLGEVLREISLQHSGAVADSSIASTGKLLGAELLLTSGLHRTPDGYELVLKLLRVSTGELLSATRARIAPALMQP